MEVIQMKRPRCIFAISRKAPEAIKQAIKILEYSGVVTLDVEATKFRYDYYDRYQLNFGIVLLSMAKNKFSGIL